VILIKNFFILNKLFHFVLINPS